MTSPRPAHILPVLIVSQFAGTSLWFAGNAVLNDLAQAWQLAPTALGAITSAVQAGFICGTLVFAILALADRLSPRKVFLGCAAAGALANIALLVAPQQLSALLACRFVTGFFLAGIYPVGMKIASGWYRSGLGNALGFLVGALVLGTAFPYLLKAAGQSWPWQTVLLAVSALALAGGALMYLLVPDGPYLAKGARFDPRALRQLFSAREFRASAFGYFGHMWELYAFWTFVPLVLAACAPGWNVPLWTFIIIAAGAAGCAGGGLISLRIGSARVAAIQLGASGTCCLLSPLLLLAPPAAVIAVLVFWGVVVAGDSPQFSALTAANAQRDQVGTALTISNSIGFAITIISIQLLSYAAQRIDTHWLLLLLAPGPAFGLWALRPMLKPEAQG